MWAFVAGQTDRHLLASRLKNWDVSQHIKVVALLCYSLMLCPCYLYESWHILHEPCGYNQEIVLTDYQLLLNKVNSLKVGDK